MERTFAMERATFDNAIPRISNGLRPDAYFYSVQGKSVLLDIGGSSKVTGITKYSGMADYIFALLH